MKPIGQLKTPYGTKFGVPKQSGLVAQEESLIELESEFQMESVQGLEQGCFLWILFLFDRCAGRWSVMSRPPRLGGNAKVGVFAARAPYRPNNIGLSLVRLDRIFKRNGRVCLLISGADAVNATPVLDIKPYHQMADSPWEKPSLLWFDELNQDGQERKRVTFSKEVCIDDKFKQLIESVLSLDPRPGYHEDSDRIYCNELDGREIYWKCDENSIEVFSIKKKAG